MKVQTIYTVDYSTEEDIKQAEELRSDLYEKFDSVQVCPNGLHEVRIICEEPIQELNL